MKETMDHRARKIIVAGVLICLIGSVLEVSLVSVDSWIGDWLGPTRGVGIWIAEVIAATVRFGVAPFGAALAAIGTALYWVRGNGSTGNLRESEQHRDRGSRGTD